MKIKLLMFDHFEVHQLCDEIGKINIFDPLLPTNATFVSIILPYTLIEPFRL